MEIWLNPACSKCRTAQAALDEAGVSYTVRRYLDDPPTTAELEAVLGRLGLDPWHITRLAEDDAATLGMKSWPKDDANRARWIEALSTHPKLIQRPIITADDGTTVVGREQGELDRVMKAAGAG
jgi:arsenate reductase